MAHAAPNTPADWKLPPRRVLVVDDRRDGLVVLSRLLELLGQNVKTAGSAAEALEAVATEQPDVVISDIGMPGMDGYELAQRLASDPKMAGAALVALTGYDQQSDRDQAKQAGFNYHLCKPVSLEALRELLLSLPPRESTSAE